LTTINLNIKVRIFLFSILFIATLSGTKAQSFEVANGDTINRIDSLGHKQGMWKYWDNNMSLALVCYYLDDVPVGKMTYYRKNRTLLELEPQKRKAEITWRYFGGGKPVIGKLKKGPKKFEFVTSKGKKLSRKEIEILVELLELDASYVGGYFELFRYFKENIHFPVAAKQAKKEGIVEVTFRVREDGHIDDVKLVSGFDVDCNEAALECVKSMPQWRPATKMGYAFESQVKVPVRFKL
jgi:TonB family protein